MVYADLELHRRNPMFHLGELDLACYDKDYAPEAERHAARAAHLAAWPTVIDAAVASLDAIPAPIADSLLGAVRGLAAGIPADADPGAREAALAAHARLVAHVQRAAESGPPDAALGAGRAGRAAVVGRGDRRRPGRARRPGRRRTGPADGAAGGVGRRYRHRPRPP